MQPGMAFAKLKIITLDPSPQNKIPTIVAQYNPKELQQDKQIPWHKQKRRGPADLEYTGCEGWTMSLELLFDGFEGELDVLAQVTALKSLTQHFGSKPSEARPPKVRLLWGQGEGTLPAFTAVVESVGIKYTMFGPDGQILRATATVKLKEAADLKVGRPRD